MSKTKVEGCLNIKDLQVWNETSASKQLWNIGTKNSLWMKWINCNYLKEGDFMNYLPKLDVSWYWRRLYKVKEDLLIKPENPLLLFIFTIENGT